MQLPLPMFVCGYALGTDSSWPSGHEFESEFEFVFQAQCSAGEGDRLDAVIRLPQREVAGNSQHRAQARDARVNGLSLGDTMK